MRGMRRLTVVILATPLVIGFFIAMSAGLTQAASPTPTVTVVVPTATATAVLPTATATTAPTANATTIPAEMWYVPDSITFTATEGGTNPSYKILSVGNAGGGLMHWTATSPMGWLNLIPPLGTLTSPSQIASIQAHVDITGLTPGVYPGVIYLYSSDAVNSPQIVDVILTVRSRSGTVAPNATATATATATSTSTPTDTSHIGEDGGATSHPGEGGALPPWVWPVVGVLVAICAVLAGISLATSGLLGKMFKKGGEEVEGLPSEDAYEGEYGKPGGDAGEDSDEL